LPNEKLGQYKKRMTEVPGAFDFPNLGVFEVLNDLQVEKNIEGDMLEIGCYLGRSSIVLGYLLEDGEELHVCEPFPKPDPDDPDFLAHTIDWYEPYTQELFEQHYLTFHTQLPHIYANASLELPGKLSPGTFRFVHMDGSHNAKALASDIALTRSLLVDGGIVAFSQFRSLHTLEVSQAVFGELAGSSLQPLCATPNHLYASWNPEPLGDLEDLPSRLDQIPSMKVVMSEFDGRPVPLIHPPRPGTTSGVKSFVPPVMLPLARKARTALMRKDR
jgi:hypothetical protein